MSWLNYHHLLYFWTVAREGSISKACEKLHLTQPTVSSQIQSLESALGRPLFDRTGKRLVLTETGRLVYRYADEIFRVGRELMDVMRGRPVGSPMRFVVGVADALPKLIVHRLLEPAVRLPEPVHLICHEGKPEALLSDLANHALDMVLSDSPIPPADKTRAFNHHLGDSAIGFFGVPETAERLRSEFPRSLEGVAMLLPAVSNSLRRAIDRWFDSEGIRPNVVGEFEDSALLKVFGQEGLGVFPGPVVIEEEIRRQYDVELIGRVDSIREHFYAVTLERKLKHPAAAAITDTARRTFEQPAKPTPVSVGEPD